MVFSRNGIGTTGHANEGGEKEPKKRPCIVHKI